VEIEFNGSYALSASETEAGFFVLLSKVEKDRIDLLRAESIEIRGKVSGFLRRSLGEVSGYLPVDPIGLRANLSSTWGSLMTQHLMRVHDHLNRDSDDVVAYTAWRYDTLTAWGEASAARELALEMKMSVHTIHYRIKLARKKGLLPSPGTGARLGR